jgi:hypothetical protein
LGLLIIETTSVLVFKKLDIIKKLRFKKKSAKVIKPKKVVNNEIKTEKVIKNNLNINPKTLKIIGMFIVSILFLALIGLGVYYLVETKSLDKIDLSLVKEKTKLSYDYGKESLIWLKD